MPLQLVPCRRRGRSTRVGIQVVGRRASVTVPAGVGIAGAPERQVRFRIVAGGVPDGTAAVLPRVAGPRLVASGASAEFGCGVESPELLAGLDVVRGHPAIGAHLVGRRSEDDHVSDDERGHVVLVALLVVDQDLVPEHAARLHVDREQVTVDGGPEQPVPGDGHPFVDFVGVVVLLRIERPRKLPILAPCHGVQAPRPPVRCPYT